MKAPEAVIEELMTKVRLALFQGKQFKRWPAQQELVKKALLYPAVCLDKHQVEIPAERYQAILEDIIATAAKHGNLGDIAYMSRYFYTCVQRHMAHHGDEYYSEGKSIRNRINLDMTAIERAHAGHDGTVPILAQAAAAKADAVLQVGRRKAKIKPAAPRLQPDLFSPAKPSPIAKLRATSAQPPPNCQTAP
jgi:hypothetical protein